MDELKTTFRCECGNELDPKRLPRERAEYLLTAADLDRLVEIAEEEASAGWHDSDGSWIADRISEVARHCYRCPECDRLIPGEKLEE